MTEPVSIRGVEINSLRGSFETLVPGMLAVLPDRAVAMLEMPLIEATVINKEPIDMWWYKYCPRNFATR